MLSSETICSKLRIAIALSTMTAVNVSTPIPQIHYQRHFRYRDILPDRSNGVWKIERGIVRTLTWDDRGTTISLGFWGKGQVVGQPLSKMYPFEMQCLTSVAVIQLAPVDFLEDPTLQATLTEQFGQLESLLAIMHCKSIADRLMSLLEWLSQRFGKDVPQGRLVQLRLTHQEIAETIGTSRVTVTRLLSELEQSGRIARSRQHGLFVLPLQKKV